MSDTDRQARRESQEHDVKSTSTSRFRFKSKQKHRDAGEHDSKQPDDSLREPSRSRDTERTHRHRRHHHRSKRRRYSPEEEERAKEPSRPPFDADAAFRESLFDAMADDEGAQYWEGVYGQPIHTYSDKKQTPTGELEQMTDEEYTAFVRAKMYEKTHQHLIEEKARREAARKERAAREKEGEKVRRQDAHFRELVETSIRQGEERRSRKAWSQRWESYLTKWQELGTRNDTVASHKLHLASMPWPVESGRNQDISKDAVQRFFLNAPSAGQPTESQLQKTLKSERIRWHPDKIQQKLGGQDVGEEVMQAVTQVFQIIDDLWSEVRRQDR